MQLPRIQAFEFTDLPWWPGFLRGLLTDFLQTYTRLVRPFHTKLDLILRATDAAGVDDIVDLCSGAGGPWLGLGDDIQSASGRRLRVLLTDRYPNRGLGQRFESVDGVSYHPESIDARSVPRELAGTRTIFDGFHHFPPDEARAILQDAVSQRQPIVVFEILRRTPGNLLTMTLAWIHALLLTPLVRPFSIVRLLLTYVIPLAPLLIAWDGSISTLRCYTPAELLAMARDTQGGKTYRWEAGEYQQAGMFPVTYLVGYPEGDESPTP
jgi:hypothetical protein